MTTVWFKSNVAGVLSLWVVTAESKSAAIAAGRDYADSNGLRCAEWYCCADNQPCAAGIRRQQ